MSKAYLVWAKKVQKSYLSQNWRGIQIWRGIDLSFQNWHKEFDKFWPEHSKVSKIFTLMGSFWAKYILFELKKYRGVIFHGIEQWCKIWRKTDLLLRKSHEEFCKFSPELSKVSKLELCLSKVENVWAYNLQRSYDSWQWRMIQKLKRNLLVILKLTWETSKILTRALESLKKLVL